MTRANLIMYGVAGVAALSGIAVIARPAADAPAVYRRRIAGTMLFAFALILASFATVTLTAGKIS